MGTLGPILRLSTPTKVMGGGACSTYVIPLSRQGDHSLGKGQVSQLLFQGYVQQNEVRDM